MIGNAHKNGPNMHTLPPFVQSNVRFSKKNLHFKVLQLCQKLKAK